MRSDPRIGTLLSARAILTASAVLGAVWLAALPATAGHAVLTGWLVAAWVWLAINGRRTLERIEVVREHRPGVFEGDRVPITLRLRCTPGPPIGPFEVRDISSISFQHRRDHLIPELPPGWEVRLHYEHAADRHRGRYVLGPVRLRDADPLGVFYRSREVPCLTELTVYPRAEPLPGYRVPAPAAWVGASMDARAQAGQGELILGVREYRPGDPPSRIHWRTSARRGSLFVALQDRPIQCELAVMLDLTRRARFGLGGEATTERAIRAAAALLSRAFETRHRCSLTIAQQEPIVLPSGSGQAHLHLLLDRLATIGVGGETDFWALAAQRAMALAPGSRAVWIAPAFGVLLDRAESLVRQLSQRAVAVDVVVLDHRRSAPIYGDQQPEPGGSRPPSPERLIEALRRAGARVWLMGERPLAELVADEPPAARGGEALGRAIACSMRSHAEVGR